MASELDWLTDRSLSDAVEELEQLLSQASCAFLLGAGCSCCAGLPLMGQLTQHVLSSTDLSPTTKDILHTVLNQFGESSPATIEDLMSELVDLLSIGERRSACRAECASIQVGGREYQTEQIRDALTEIKSAIVRSIDREEIDLSHHRAFVRAIHNGLRSGKSQQGSPVYYFTLNYDTVLEDSLGHERIPFTDGFLGGATGWWEPSTFEDERVSARVVKIHGSIDWRLLEGDTCPRRFRKGTVPERDADRVVIWPAVTKYREAQRDPYAQMIALMREVLRPQGPREVVLTICGYRFADAHINLELDRALKESERRLTIVAFTGNERPEDLLAEWIGDTRIRDQVRVYAKRGIFHGARSYQTAQDVNWWRFEILAKLLGGQR